MLKIVKHDINNLSILIRESMMVNNTKYVLENKKFFTMNNSQVVSKYFNTFFLQENMLDTLLPEKYFSPFKSVVSDTQNSINEFYSSSQNVNVNGGELVNFKTYGQTDEYKWSMIEKDIDKIKHGSVSIGQPTDVEITNDLSSEHHGIFEKIWSSIAGIIHSLNHYVADVLGKCGLLSDTVTAITPYVTGFVLIVGALIILGICRLIYSYIKRRISEKKSNGGKVNKQKARAEGLSLAKTSVSAQKKAASKIKDPIKRKKALIAIKRKEEALRRSISNYKY